MTYEPASSLVSRTRVRLGARKKERSVYQIRLKT